MSGLAQISLFLKHILHLYPSILNECLIHICQHVFLRLFYHLLDITQAYAVSVPFCCTCFVPQDGALVLFMCPLCGEIHRI